MVNPTRQCVSPNQARVPTPPISPPTAVADGDEWVINGEKIYVTDGERSDTLVVWATLDKSLGKAAIKSFIVEKGTSRLRGYPVGTQDGHPGI